MIADSFPKGVTRTQLIDFFNQHDKISALLLLLMIAASLVLPGMPTTVLYIVGGIVLGDTFAFVVSFLGAVLGNSLAIFIFKHLDKFAKKHSHAKNAFFENLSARIKNPYLFAFVGYTVPVIPTTLVNYNLSERQLTEKKQLQVVAFGSLGSSFLYTFASSALLNQQFIRFSILILVIVGLHYFVREKEKKR